MDMDIDQGSDPTQRPQTQHLEVVANINATRTQTEGENQGCRTKIRSECCIEHKDASSSLPISLTELMVLRRQSNSKLDVGGEESLQLYMGSDVTPTNDIHANGLSELGETKFRVLEPSYVNLECGRPTFDVDETLREAEDVVAFALSPAPDEGIVCGKVYVESGNVGDCEKDLDRHACAFVFPQDHSDETSKFMVENEIENPLCNLISESTQSCLDGENILLSDLPEDTKLESILQKVKSLQKPRSQQLHSSGVRGRRRKESKAVIEEKKLNFKRWTSPRRKQVNSMSNLSLVKTKENFNLQDKGSSSRMPNNDVSESDDEYIGETLRSFKNRLLRKKQAEALKRKTNEKPSGLKKRIDINTDNKYVLQRTHDFGCMQTPRGEPVTIVTKTPNELARDVAKEALLEAGFTIELRPRQSREYNDSVYVSPAGHVYWSLPRAWEALKQENAEMNLKINRNRNSKKTKYEEVLDGRRTNGHGRVDKRTLKQVLLSFGDDKRLLSALKKSCNFSGTCIHDIISQVEVTNATLADILLVDLGLLRRLTSKSKEREACKIPIPIDEREERKRKRGNGNVSMTVVKTPSSNKVQSKQVKSLQHTPQISKISNISRSESVRKRNRKEKVSKKDVSKITKTKCKKQDASSKKGKKARARNGFRLEARPTNIDDGPERQCEWTVFSWMIDRGAVLEKEKIFCVDRVSNRTLKDGVVTREGILCRCCKKVYTGPAFESHATHNVAEPLCDLVFSSGRSILDHQLEAWTAELDLRKTQNYVGVSANDTNDDTCILCGDGGDLICCDQCPSTFHMSCLEIDDIPEGNWYCPKCRCGKCGGSMDSSEDELTMVQCKQCEHSYHLACLQSNPIVDGKVSFCGHACKKIFSGLRQLVGIPQHLTGGLSWSLLRCMDKDSETGPTDRKSMVEQHSKLAVALLVIKECFNPMVDPRTNIDMITQSMYNRWSEFDRLNYDGFYTAILEREGEIISVATVRIHGSRVAEMPLIGTRQKYRRKGMCRLLVDVIEKLLCSLEVSTFILPAIPELFHTWTHAFGFKPLCKSPKLEIKDLSMMVFPGTELLQKPLSGISNGDTMVEESKETGSALTQNVDGEILHLGVAANLSSSTFVATDLIEDIFVNSSVISSSPLQDVSNEIEVNLGTCAEPMVIHQNYQIIG